MRSHLTAFENCRSFCEHLKWGTNKYSHSFSNFWCLYNSCLIIKPVGGRILRRLPCIIHFAGVGVGPVIIKGSHSHVTWPRLKGLRRWKITDYLILSSSKERLSWVVCLISWKSLKERLNREIFLLAFQKEANGCVVRGPLRGMWKGNSRGLWQLRIKGRRVEVFLQPQGSVNNLKEGQKAAPGRNAGQSTP